MIRNLRDSLLTLGGLATFVVGVMHLQQYADFIKDVPTIGTLFLVNSLAAGLVCVMLATRRRTIAAVGGVAVSAGALVSLAIARFSAGGLFDYTEPTLRPAVLTSVAAELIAVLCLAAYLAIRTRPPLEANSGQRGEKRCSEMAGPVQG